MGTLGNLNLMGIIECFHQPRNGHNDVAKSLGDATFPASTTSRTAGKNNGVSTPSAPKTVQDPQSKIRGSSAAVWIVLCRRYDEQEVSHWNVLDTACSSVPWVVDC
jgi:hypothetical protein